MNGLPREQHPLARQTVKLSSTDPAFDGKEYWVEDWWENVGGCSWMNAVGNPACMGYATRLANTNLPLDNDAVYGKISELGYIVHASELPAAAQANTDAA